MFNITDLESEQKLLTIIARELDYLCDHLVPQHKEQEPVEIEDSEQKLECESPSYFNEIGKYVGKYFLVPADRYILGRKVVAFKIEGYVTLSENISRQQKK